MAVYSIGATEGPDVQVTTQYNLPCKSNLKTRQADP